MKEVRYTADVALRLVVAGLVTIIVAGCASEESAPQSTPVASSPISPLSAKDSNDSATSRSSERVVPEPTAPPTKDVERVRKKVARLIRGGNGTWILHGEATDEAAMCLLVMRSEWRRFTASDRRALGTLINEKIAELQSNPEKYTSTEKGSMLWDHVMTKIANVQPAVILSDKKHPGNDFEISTVLRDFAGPDPEPVKTPEKEEGPTLSLSDQLMTAVAAGEAKEVEKLLKAGANPNSTWSSNDMPALSAAAVSGNVEIVKLLVENGADVNGTEKTFGWTALEFARNELKNETRYPEKYEAVISYLEDRS